MPPVQYQANAGQQIPEKANRSGGQSPLIVTRKSRDHDNRNVIARASESVQQKERGY
jgi:hypothetical protein